MALITSSKRHYHSKVKNPSSNANEGVKTKNDYIWNYVVNKANLTKTIYTVDILFNKQYPSLYSTLIKTHLNSILMFYLLPHILLVHLMLSGFQGLYNVERSKGNIKILILMELEQAR